jgi:hypothetical protein
MTFHYPALALDSNQLRLLKPVPKANKRVLEFEILQVPRGVAPLYTAVSYTWGDARPSEVILLNGQIFHISVTLWSCLYYLCLHEKLAGWTHIWVDAICINQDSLAEKSAQVRLMDETYQRAVCVSVWLGLVPVPGEEQWRLNTYEPIRTLDMESFEWADHMSDLANRPYWSRFWVIQEFLLGGNVEIYCSGNQVNWLDFRQLLEYETDTDLVGDTDYLGAGNATADSYAALALVAGRHPDKHPEYLRPLHELLVEHHRSKSKDPRDRVFALLGLIPHDERRFLQRFFPDYSLSEEHVATIALGHVLFFNHGPELVTADSDALFLGLGIDHGASRRRLLKRAEDFDYIGCDGLRDFLAQMQFVDDERYGTESMDGDGEAEDEYDSSPGPGTARTIIIPLAAILVLGIWMYWHIKWR